MRVFLLLSALAATAFGFPSALIRDVAVSLPKSSGTAFSYPSGPIPSYPFKRAAAPLDICLSDRCLRRDLGLKTRQSQDNHEDPNDGYVDPDSFLPAPSEIPPYFIVADQRFGHAAAYTRRDIELAIEAGHLRRLSGRPTERFGANGRRYPHRYHDADYRIRSLPNIVSQGPFYEYPIRDGGPYQRGNPNRHRVIFDDQGRFITVVMHVRRNRSDRYFLPGHGARLNDAGNSLQLTRDEDYPGSNPAFRERYQVWIDIPDRLHHFAPHRGSGGWFKRL